MASTPLNSIKLNGAFVNSDVTIDNGLTVKGNVKAVNSLSVGTSANAADESSFVFNGDSNDGYSSNGPGTFSINPSGGTNGFYIGGKSLDTVFIDEFSQFNYSKSDIRTDPSSGEVVGMRKFLTGIEQLNNNLNVYGGVIRSSDLPPIPIEQVHGLKARLDAIGTPVHWAGDSDGIEIDLDQSYTQINLVDDPNHILVNGDIVGGYGSQSNEEFVWTEKTQKFRPFGNEGKFIVKGNVTNADIVADAGIETSKISGLSQFISNTGTSIETLSGSISQRVVANPAVASGTACKITYDEKGLVTAGGSLSASDIPSMPSSKISSMTGYQKYANVEAISTADTLNTAIGKLEASVDAKQPLLSDPQKSAIDSGITGAKVGVYDGYAEQISSKATSGEVASMISTALSTIATQPTSSEDTNAANTKFVHDVIKSYLSRFFPNDLELNGTLGTVAEQAFSGYPIEPALSVSCRGTALSYDSDYTASFSDNTNVGTAEVTVNGKGSYTGSLNGEFSIVKRQLSDCTVVANGSKTYDGDPATPSVDVTIVSASAYSVPNTEWTLSYDTPIVNAGHYPITVTANPNSDYMTGSATTAIDIARKSIAELTATVNPTAYVYTGSQIVPTIDGLSWHGEVATHTTAYRLSGTSEFASTAPTNVGTYDIRLNGTLNYDGNIELLNAFSITPKDASNFKVDDILPQPFQGEGVGVTPTPTVYDSPEGGDELTVGVDFDYSYANNTSVTTSAECYVYFKNNYSNFVKKLFSIVESTAAAAAAPTANDNGAMLLKSASVDTAAVQSDTATQTKTKRRRRTRKSAETSES